MNDGAKPLPSPERILRRLFWLLLLRGRTATRTGKQERKPLGIRGQMAIYALLGLLPAIAAFHLPPLAFAAGLHGLTMLFASLALATSAGQMLFVREESEILLHRPVRPEHLLRAKVAVLVAYALLLALALNAAGLICGNFAAGLDVRWLPAHTASTLLMMIASAAAIVLVYNLCLRWFGRERLDGLLTTLQTLLAIVMVFGSQLLPRLVSADAMQHLERADGLLLLAPPIWFGALDIWLCGAMPFADAWLPASLALGGTVLLCWLAFGRLARAYGIGLMMLNEGGGAVADKTTHRRLGAIATSRFLRPWLRTPVERQAFVLASAYLLRERETRLKVFPAIAPLVLLPLVFALGSRRDDATGSFGHYMGLAYLAIVPIQPLVLIRRSEQFRAAEHFRKAPLRHWAPLFHGARKAVLFWLVLPSAALSIGVITLLRGSPDLIGIGVVALVTLPVYSLVPGLFGPWLPLSQPNRDIQDSSMGCATMGLVMAASGVVVGGTALAGHYGLSWIVAPGIVLASLLAHRMLAKSIAATRWSIAKR